MVDQTLGIYEPPVSNSGFLGGKFLERQRVQSLQKSSAALRSDGRRAWNLLSKVT